MSVGYIEGYIATLWATRLGRLVTLHIGFIRLGPHLIIGAKRVVKQPKLIIPTAKNM